MSNNDFSSPSAAPAADQAPAGSSSAHAASAAAAPPEFLDAHSRRRLAWALGIAGGFVLLLLGATYGTYLWHFHGPASTDAGVWGQFGDFVGGTLNSLMGLLTLLALVFTVVLQTRQLELSRDELSATRDELARSTAAQRDAADAMKGQLEQARLTAEAQKEAANALKVATTLQSQLVKVTIEQGKVAESAANAQWRAAQIAGLSEGIRLAQHHLANLPNMRNPDPPLMLEAERIATLEMDARDGFWKLFEKVIDGARSEQEQASK